jgi:hypothetical protein
MATKTIVAPIIGIALVAILELGVGGLPARAAEAPEQVDVYISGQDGYDTYRIPSVIVTKKGTVLATAISKGGGMSWSAPAFERGARSAYEKITLARFGLSWLTDGKDR